MPELAVLDVVLLAVGAALVGLSKTALPGASTLAVALFAAVLPARESTGALLLLLLVGDLFALHAYRAHADWRVLRRLAPAVLVGVALGVWFLAAAGDTVVRRVIGVVLLGLVAVTLGRRAAARRRAGRAATTTPPPVPLPAPVPTGGRERAWVARGYGALAGFTTMVANAGGPVMSLYFLASRFGVERFLGSAAWFFFAVNVTKLPFSVGLGLVDAGTVRLDLLLAPAVVVGALVGRALARRMRQMVFERLVLGLTVVSAAYLVV